MALAIASLTAEMVAMAIPGRSRTVAAKTMFREVAFARAWSQAAAGLLSLASAPFTPPNAPQVRPVHVHLLRSTIVCSTEMLLLATRESSMMTQNASLLTRSIMHCTGIQYVPTRESRIRVQLAAAGANSNGSLCFIWASFGVVQ